MSGAMISELGWESEVWHPPKADDVTNVTCPHYIETEGFDGRFTEK